jgi:hypothetical protein
VQRHSLILGSRPPRFSKPRRSKISILTLNLSVDKALVGVGVERFQLGLVRNSGYVMSWAGGGPIMANQMIDELYKYFTDTFQPTSN